MVLFHQKEIIIIMKITRERRAKRYSKIAVEICLVLLKKAKAKQIFLLKE